MKAPSASLGQTDVFHTWHPHLHQGFVEGNLYVKKIKQNKTYNTRVIVHHVKLGTFSQRKPQDGKMLTSLFKVHPDQEVDAPGRQSTTLSLKSDIKQINKDNSLPRTSCRASQPVSSLSSVCDSDPGAGRQLQSTAASSSSHPPL